MLTAGVERAIDTVLMALTAAHVGGRIVGVQDIEQAATAAYTGWVAGQVGPRLVSGPCGPCCPLREGITETASALGRAIAEHVMVEIDLLIQLRDATGREPAEVLRMVRDRCDRGASDAG